jgi:serine/threonine protein phosphatase PrpC
MSCNVCGADVRPEDKFCEGCGSRTDAIAVAAAPKVRCLCGCTQFDGEGYCLECGQKLRNLPPVESAALNSTLAWATHPGRNHAENQDAVAVRRLADGTVLLAVADGVSSADRAREASRMVAQSIVNELESGLSSYGNDALHITLQRAHDALCQLPREDMRRDDPQATIVAAVVTGCQVRYAWVGDSRIYALGVEEARQLTEDDSWLNEALRAGIPYDVAVHDRNAHCITQCLGMREAVPEIHQDQAELMPGSWLVLCTDGLWNYFDEPTTLMARVLDHFADGPAVAMCESWVEQANEAGGVDNITVAALRVG